MLESLSPTRIKKDSLTASGMSPNMRSPTLSFHLPPPAPRDGQDLTSVFPYLVPDGKDAPLLTPLAAPLAPSGLPSDSERGNSWS